MSRRRKISVKPLKRNGNGVKWEPVCMNHCGADLPANPVRSNTWAGIIGLRATFCSPECRDEWDAENVSHQDATMELQA